MALRLLWNPQWNENLFLTSCVEKLIDDPSARAMDELLSRVAGTIDLGDNCEGAISELYLKVRALVIKRVNGAIIQEIVFISEPYRLDCLRVGDTR